MTTYNPVFNHTPVNLTYYTGETATLRCSVSHLGSSKVGVAEHMECISVKTSKGITDLLRNRNNEKDYKTTETIYNI